MHTFLTLVYITAFSIKCQAITVRDDDVYDSTPKTYTYSNSELPRSEIGYRQEDYYKPLRRADVRAYQYTSEENNQEPDYSQQQTDQDIENYPFTQRDQRQQIASRRAPSKKLHVEQYLKEVTPTTKTTYNQRSTNYLRLNSQPRDGGIKEQTEELRGSLKQPSIQYIVQPDLQQKSGTHPQIQYVIPEQKATHFRSGDQQSHSTTLTAYQNALLAHQKVLETEGQDETSRSSIYVSHSIPKKPVRKIVKPATRDEDTEQYTQLQQYELQQQKQPGIYQRQQPAPVMYQTKLEYSNSDADIPTSTELPSYQDKLKQLRERLQDLSQYQQIPTEQPLQQEEKIVYQHPQQLVGYQQILSNQQVKIPRPLKLKPQGPPETSYQRPEATFEYRAPPRVEESESIQYQQPNYLKKGPKYLPEPKAVQYQPSVSEETEEKYQQIISVPNQRPEGLISYEAAIAKLQAEKLLKPSQQRLRSQITYQQEPGTQTVGYTLQYPDENQDRTVPETRYVTIGDKYRSVENAPASPYRQSQQNDNIRYYRNPRKPAVSYSHQQ